VPKAVACSAGLLAPSDTEFNRLNVFGRQMPSREGWIALRRGIALWESGKVTILDMVGLWVRPIKPCWVSDQAAGR